MSFHDPIAGIEQAERLLRESAALHEHAEKRLAAREFHVAADRLVPIRKLLAELPDPTPREGADFYEGRMAAQTRYEREAYAFIEKLRVLLAADGGRLT